VLIAELQSSTEFHQFLPRCLAVTENKAEYAHNKQQLEKAKINGYFIVQVISVLCNTSYSKLHINNCHAKQKTLVVTN